jgi:CheY-like chemotaxis protein
MARILLAEDDDMLRVMTRTILELGGHEVFAFPNGLRALEAFDTIHPDMLVSDVSMPLMDGFDLLDGIRSLESGKAVPFLFLSARSEHEDV